MREQINNEKGKATFIELGSAALSSLRVGKMLFCRKRVFLYKFYKRLQNKRVGVLISYIRKGYFLKATVKRGIDFKLSNTLFQVSSVVLYSCIGTQLTRKGPPLPPPRSTQPVPNSALSKLGPGSTRPWVNSACSSLTKDDTVWVPYMSEFVPHVSNL